MKKENEILSLNIKLEDSSWTLKDKDNLSKMNLMNNSLSYIDLNMITIDEWQEVRNDNQSSLSLSRNNRIVECSIIDFTLYLK